jgi:hypothetical protein
MWAAQLSGMLFLAQERSIYLRGTVTVYFKITKFSGESRISATTLHSLDFKKKKSVRISLPYMATSVGKEDIFLMP